VNAWGQPMVPKRFGEAFSAFCAEHGFDVTFHGLRHSAAILMLSAGVDVRTVAGRLGHSNASITLNTYSHYVRSADEAAAEARGVPRQLVANRLLTKLPHQPQHTVRPVSATGVLTCTNGTGRHQTTRGET
jgi:hypothetical protein